MSTNVKRTRRRRIVYSATRAPLLCGGVQRSASADGVGGVASASSAGASGAAGGTEKRTGRSLHGPSTPSSTARTLRSTRNEQSCHCDGRRRT